jgi:hypothetical protein
MAENSPIRTSFTEKAMKKVAVVAVILIALAASFLLGRSTTPCRQMRMVDGESGLACDIGDYIIIYPIYSSDPTLSVSKGENRISVSERTGVSISYDQNKSAVMVNGILSKGGDRSLTYYVFDETAYKRRWVQDIGIDGQADYKWYVGDDGESGRIAFLDGSWHEMVLHGGKRGILIDNTFREVIRGVNGLKVLAEEPVGETP